ncbi:MAG TPA: hypothetical protein VFS16_04560 [Acidimicrobiia bacterium]|nr:hypothetical protein [Acidimicrobiia bacterium]
MAETMSNVERVLWRIAELGARCSQQGAAGSRGPLWAELEQTIAGLEAELEAARQAVDIAPAQVRTLEGRLKVARQERDREKARNQEHVADAEAARRERDRERHRARKAMTAAAAARTAAAESAARVAAAEAATDQAMAARDEAVAALDEAVATGERAAAARDQALAALEEATARIAELESALDAVAAERDTAVAAQAVASAERDEAVDSLNASADAAVVVLPGVSMPDAPAEGPIAVAGPATPAGPRVAWQPTWSEWSRDAVEEPAAEVDVAEEVEVDLGAAEEGVRRYLNVAATIGQLLPDDLAPYLLSGATVIRREGRLFATVAVTTNPWATTGSDGDQQARVFADAGFRVEWTTAAPLAC